MAQMDKLRRSRAIAFLGEKEFRRKPMIKLIPRLAGVFAIAFFGFASSPLHAEAISCDSEGKDLQKAIDNAAPDSTLFISGTCDTGGFLIRKNLKLIGPATLSGGSTVLQILGHDVEIINVNIDANGSDQGILTTGTTLLLNHVDVEGAAITGISLDQSSAAIISNESVFSNNGVFGIGVSGSSAVNLNHTTIENNGHDGLLVQMSSHANTSHNTIDGNGVGIEITSNASIFLVDSTITNNTNVGVFATRQGYVQGAGAPSTFGNNGTDVLCTDRGILGFDSGPQLPATGTIVADGTCIIKGSVF